VTVTATPGTFFNPTPPAAVGARALLNQRIVELIFGALGPALPERVSAGSGQWINPIFGGLDPKSGRRFVYYDYAVAGVGARLTKDGVDAVSPIVSVENIPVEAQESRNPIVVERFELVTDSGGAGRTRGGLAVRKDVRMLADGVTLSNLTDRQRFPPYGLDGGVEGTLGLTILNRGTEGEEKLESKGTYVLRENDVISFQCSGSGGFGSPLERDHELVREDLREGRISAQAAREFYKFDPDEEREIT
jgi:N-methylhydantoinase B